MKVTVLLLLLVALAYAAPPTIRLDNKSTRIVGGQSATRNQFPYQVSFQWGLLGIFQHVCGGSIVTRNRVITAGHCITELPGLGTLRIRAGLLNLGDTSDVQTITVTSSVVHPNYGGVAYPTAGLVCLKITGVMRTTPTASMEMLLGLKPLHVGVELEARKGAFRLQGLGTWKSGGGRHRIEVNERTDRLAASAPYLGQQLSIAIPESKMRAEIINGVGPNDIAVLFLLSSLTFNSAVQPISLPAAGSVATGTAVLSGWGSTSSTIIPSMPETLQFVNIPLLTLQQCANALINLFGTSSPLADNNVCTGPLTGGVSACSGDSGGPLAQNNELVGVVSWGVSPCGTTGAPSVYVQVSNYTSWLAQYL
ncbi:Serine protease [Rhyzopertha dominica]|nr:Serine protease [Rhyzopertha dominica]